MLFEKNNFSFNFHLFQIHQLFINQQITKFSKMHRKIKKPKKGEKSQKHIPKFFKVSQR